MHNFKCLNAIHTESLTRKLLSKFRKVKKKKRKENKKRKKMKKTDFITINLKPTDSQYFFRSSIFFNKFQETNL